jgi:hypothetical protein
MNGLHCSSSIWTAMLAKILLQRQQFRQLEHAFLIVSSLSSTILMNTINFLLKENFVSVHMMDNKLLGSTTMNPTLLRFLL